MFIVPKDSVRYQVALAVLVTITLSWVISTGLANYLSYLNIKAIRQTMLAQPGIYPQPIPEPKFDVMDFLLGRPPRQSGSQRAFKMPGINLQASTPFQPDRRAATPPSGLNQPPPGEPPPLDVTPRNFFSPQELKWVFLRLIVALSLAVFAAMWLGNRFTKPLMELAEGARAFHIRNFDYRVPANDQSEFTEVATAMNEMAQEVSQHIHSLEEDAERRRQFLADIAHELRSPVTTMRTMAGALQDGIADEPQRRERAVAVLVRTSERMFRLVQDVMELVELDLDRLPIAKTEVDLRFLVAGVIASYEGDAAKAGIVIKYSESKAPITANVDPDRITQVLDNIVGNAVSYAGNGASVNVILEDGDTVRISIVDTGVGIPEKDIPHILDSFYRVNTARTPDENHIGLGLSIARRMLEAHGGKITISSQEGKGTNVTILIPKAL